MKSMKIPVALVLAAFLTLPAMANPRSEYGKPGMDVNDLEQQKLTEWPRLLKGNDLIGATVRNTHGDDLGTIEDLILDSEGRNIDRVVVATGGVLGMGEEHHTVGWNELNIRNHARDVDAQARLDMTADQLAKAETFRSEDRERNPDSRRLSKFMGRDVKNAHGEHVGEIHDVAIDARPGRLEFALVDMDDGVLDLDTDLTSVPWTDLDVAEDAVRVSLTEQQMEQSAYDGDLDKLSRRLEDRPATRYGSMDGSMKSINGEVTKVKMHERSGTERVMLNVKTDDGRTMMVDGGEAEHCKKLNLQEGDRVSITGTEAPKGKEKCDLTARTITSNGKTVEVSSRTMKEHRGSKKHDDRY